MINFKNFYNVWFYDHTMNLTPLDQLTKELAETASYTAEYNFDEIPDLPIEELVKELICSLPTNFVFVRSTMLLARALEEFCKKIGRTDIRFIDPVIDIDPEWFEYAKMHYFVSMPFTLHELYTVEKLSRQGIKSGLTGHPMVIQDFGIIVKNSENFYTNKPNWQIQVPYWDIPARIMHDKCENFLIPNFSLLMCRAFLRQTDVARNASLLSSLMVQRIGEVGLAILLMPTTNHVIKDIFNAPRYPFYPGLIVRKFMYMQVPIGKINVD